MKYKIMIGVLAGKGTSRTDVGRFLFQAATARFIEDRIRDRIEELYYVPIQYCPTPSARNYLVARAKQEGCDILHMVDDDSAPHDDWFTFATNFLMEHPGPAVIAAPHMSHQLTGSQIEVMEHRPQTTVPMQAWAVDHVSLNDGIHRTGIQPVANCSTHTVAYNVKAFDRIKPPWYNYLFKDILEIEKVSTEDCTCHMRLWQAGVPLYVSWEHWSGHWITTCHTKPLPIDRKQVAEYMTNHAAAIKAAQEWQSTEQQAQAPGQDM